MVSAKEKQNLLVWTGAGLLLLMLTAVPDLYCQETTPLQIPAAELVRQTIEHELQAAKNASHRHLFRSRKQLPRGSQTRLYVETEDSMAGMTIAINDQPVSPQQQKSEEDHLYWLAGNPEQLRKKRAREKEDEERTLRILRAMPNAFRYEYDGIENAGPGLGRVGNALQRLKFSPNPSYSPPTRVEQVLEGMQGYLLVDAAARRLALIDGTLFRDVTFGWGIIGHLDKGGRFRVQQADVGDDSWQITSMSLKITGKILLFKGISIISEESFSDFQPVTANLSFAKGVELLKAEQAKLVRSANSDDDGKAER